MHEKVHVAEYGVEAFLVALQQTKGQNLVCKFSSVLKYLFVLLINVNPPHQSCNHSGFEHTPPAAQQVHYGPKIGINNLPPPKQEHLAVTNACSGRFSVNIHTLVTLMLNMGMKIVKVAFKRVQVLR